MLANRRTARAAADRAIGAFKGHLRAAVGQARYVAVPNRRPGIGGNSQTCLCGAAVPKTLKERTHCCPACGLTAPRDQVSANIVMGCAFGTTHLQPGAGHAFVRRGGTQVVGASAPSHECESTSEAPLKRQLFTTPSERHNTADAQATAIVKNTRHRRRRASLPVATQPLAV
jgi:ribosomal protein L24E